MADISYNGIVFSLVKTNTYHMEPVMTEDGTQYLYTRVILDVTGILNPAAMAYVGNTPPLPIVGTLPPQTITSIRNTLMQPRGQLIWSFAIPNAQPYVVLSSPEIDAPCDFNNGPRPLFCDITNVIGSKTAVIRFAVETFINECPSGGSGTPLLANRFTQSLSTDEQHLDSITTTGIAYFRTDFLQVLGNSPDAYRDIIFGTLPVVAGMYRANVHVQVAPAQNALRYTVTDRERMYDLGDTSQGDGASFITKVDADFNVVTLAEKGGIPAGSYLGVCNVRIWGDKRASNWIMTQRAFQVIANKMPIGAPVKVGFVQQIQITQSLTDRYVSANVTYRYNNSAIGLIGFGDSVLDSLRLDTVIGPWDGINPSLPWGKGTRGTSNAAAPFISTIEDACSGPFVDLNNPPDQEPYSENSDYTGTPTVSVEPVDVIPSYGTSYSPGQATYTDGKQEIKYYRSSGKIGCPYSGPASGSTSSSTGSGGTGTTGGSTNGMTVPVGGPSSVTPTAVFFQVSQPMSTIVVSFEAECVGQPPVVPDPNNGDSNLVLMAHSLALTSPPVAPDGQNPVFRAIGEYTYMQKSAYGLSDQLAMGILPWTSYQWANAYLNPATDYQHGLADDPNSTGDVQIPGENV